MRGEFLKSKAVFMIFVIVCAIFTISSFKEVSAEDQFGCCDVTDSGDTCAYVTEASCTEGSFVETSCEQTSYCKTGCCVSDIGKCSKNVAKGTCDALEDYSWYEGADCSVDACEEQCCVIQDFQCSYTTERNCEYLIDPYEDIELDFRSVDSESACVDICSASEKGCCVSEDGCSYGTKGECSQDYNADTGYGFYSGSYCSEVGSCSYCEPEDHKACIGEDVYWIDSCGNQDKIAQDCDYITHSTWCSELGGEAHCESIACGEVYEGLSGNVFTFDGYYEGDVSGVVSRNDHDDRMGLVREHGESWCLYESPVGDNRDRPGSQHYRSFCYFGEEILEPCQDYREEVCLQNPYNGGTAVATGAACIGNTEENSLFGAEVSGVPVGGKFWDSGSLESTCEEANIECPMLYAKTAHTDKYWEVGVNQICLHPSWTKLMGDYCRMQGDCGASANIAEDFSNSGFYMERSQETLKGGAFQADGTESEAEKKTYVGFDECMNKATEEELQPNEDGIVEWVCSGEKDVSGSCLNKDCEFIDSVEEAYLVHADDFDGGVLKADWHKDYGVGQSMESLSGEFDDMYADAGMFAVPLTGSILTVTLATIVTGGFGIAMLTATPVEVFAQLTAETAAQASTKWATAYPVAQNAWTTGWGNAIPIVGAAITIGVALVSTYGDRDKNPIEQMQASQQASVSLYVSAGISALLYIAPYIIQGGATTGPWGLAAAVVILVVAAILMSGGDTTEVSVTSHCEVWQAPTDNYDCTMCDIPVSEGGFAIDNAFGVMKGYQCTEYKCKSLGNQCEFISENQGTSRPKCVQAELNDVTEPYIEEFLLIFSDDMNDASSENNPGYTLKDSVEYDDDYDGYISTDSQYGSNVDFENNNHLKIKKEILPYQTVTFGVKTDELSQCKITQDYNATSIDEADMYFDNSYYDYHHNQSWILNPSEEYQFFVWCQDYNGNDGDKFFLVEISTNKGDDVTPVQVVGTSVVNNGFVPNTTSAMDVTFYTNEPADCYWSTNDVDVTLMENFTTSDYDCSSGATSTDSFFFEHDALQMPIEYGENTFYFACSDCAGNNNTQNHVYTLYGTEALSIDQYYPNGETFYTDTLSLSVSTSGGAEEGKSVCSYNGVDFLTTNASTHSQVLENLEKGEYSYAVDCMDVAGNKNSTSVSFTIDVDEAGPGLSSLYSSDGTVYFELDEASWCEYYYEEFEYGSGTSVVSGATSGSFAISESVSEYYVICVDEFDNEMEFTVATSI